MGAGSGLFYGLFLIWLRRLRYADPIAVTLLNCAGVAIIFAFFPGAWDVAQLTFCCSSSWRRSSSRCPTSSLHTASATYPGAKPASSPSSSLS